MPWDMTFLIVEQLQGGRACPVLSSISFHQAGAATWELSIDPRAVFWSQPQLCPPFRIVCSNRTACVSIPFCFFCKQAGKQAKQAVGGSGDCTTEIVYGTAAMHVLRHRTSLTDLPRAADTSPELANHGISKLRRCFSQPCLLQREGESSK